MTQGAGRWSRMNFASCCQPALTALWAPLGFPVRLTKKPASRRLLGYVECLPLQEASARTTAMTKRFFPLAASLNLAARAFRVVTSDEERSTTPSSTTVGWSPMKRIEVILARCDLL